MDKVSEQQKMRSEEHQSARRSRGPRFAGGELMSVLDVSKDFICVCHDGLITSINAAGANVLGRGDQEQFIGLKFVDLLSSDYSEISEDFIGILIKENAPFPAKMTKLCGNEIDAEIVVHRARELGADAVVILVHDKTIQVRLFEAMQRSEARYRKLVNNALDLICICEEGVITFINDVGAKLLKAENPSIFIGQNITEIMHQDYREIFADGVHDLIQENAMLPIRLMDIDGGLIDAEMAIAFLNSPIDTVYMVEARDITEHNQAVKALYDSIQNLEARVKERTKELSDEVIIRKKAEEELRHLATHDGLTGLPNRALLMDRITVAMAWAERHKSKLALLFIDLDGFKPVNDTLGHEAGDYLLKEVAQKLLDCERKSDTSARIGGDEFVMLLSGIKKESDVSMVAEKILKSLSKPIAIGDKEATIGASIGISIYPDDAKASDDLMKAADKAMYAVKEKGRNNYEFASGSD